MLLFQVPRRGWRNLGRIYLPSPSRLEEKNGCRTFVDAQAYSGAMLKVVETSAAWWKLPPHAGRSRNSGLHLIR